MPNRKNSGFGPRTLAQHSGAQQSDSPEDQGVFHLVLACKLARIWNFYKKTWGVIEFIVMHHHAGVETCRCCGMIAWFRGPPTRPCTPGFRGPAVEGSKAVWK